ncbi:peptide/nickel transport system permease protein [Rhodoblastus acidophilus]|uniref:ABC transporter permease n=1 Tax=Rhodoblastus acidophilus TaxID=1074 RepID=UPI002225343D|nr:ABC transporter permease [Rhodoblastus acidophilus]MCW2318663.1 peptide/nickel transport system permease protein [Rhodoblastus acidophilus]
MPETIFRLAGLLAKAMRAAMRAVLVMSCVVILVFFLMRFAPGDPVATMLGEGATEATVVSVRAQLGLDVPLLVQLGRYMAGVAVGDFGLSLSFQRPALDLVLEALPKTLLLSGISFLLTLAVAVPVGVAAALARGTRTERVISGVVLVLQTIPPFWVGIMLIHVFSLRLQILPTSGADSWRHVMLPAATLSLFQIALIVRSLRSAMLEILKEDYIRTARAKGLRRSRIVIRHVLANALNPVITVMALQLGTLLSGAVITEAVFAWPGIGSLALGAILSRDYAMAQAIVICASMLVVLLNMFADLVVSVIDPRVRDGALQSRSGFGG